LINSDMPECNAISAIQQDIRERCRAQGLHEQIHRHDLVLVGRQNSETFEELVSSVCRKCDYHFVIRTHVQPECRYQRCDSSHTRWPVGDLDAFQHHLVHISENESETGTDLGMANYPLLAVEHFACSAPLCTYELWLEISKPRVPLQWIEHVTDVDRIAGRLQQAKEDDPERFQEAVPEDWIPSGPSNLATYVKDLLEREDVRNISLRNKRFQVVFGEACYYIFERLGYKRTVISKDGMTEEYFVPNPLEPMESQVTQINTRRSYLEDVRTEIQNLIIRQGGKSNQSPAYAIRQVEMALHVPAGTHKTTHLTDLGGNEFRILGVTTQLSKELVMYAFKRQCFIAPKKVTLYRDALRGISISPPMNLDLQQAAAIEESKAESMAGNEEDHIVAAYGFFDFYPHSGTDEEIASRFMGVIVEKPEDDANARAMLQVIGKYRRSDRLVFLASSRMTEEMALVVLESSRDFSENSILMAGQQKVCYTSPPPSSPSSPRALNGLMEYFETKNLLIVFFFFLFT
jgi:ubiquitin carboxyl-terminal hydrolase 25